MKIAKQSNFSSSNPNNQVISTNINNRIGPQIASNTNVNDDIVNYAKAVDNDLINIFTVLKGRIRFGDSIDGGRGENISGEFQTFTTNATPNAENLIAHTLGAIPIGWLVINKDKAGDLYASTTAWTSSSIAFKCSVASVTYTVFLLK